MDTEIKKKWVDALRSGNYKQGLMRLRTYDNKFCCLGVLCDIVKPSAWSDGSEGYFTHEGQPVYPDESIMEEYNLNNNDIKELAYMNDSEQRIFSDIANYIEENL